MTKSAFTLYIESSFIFKGIKYDFSKLSYINCAQFLNFKGFSFMHTYLKGYIYLSLYFMTISKHFFNKQVISIGAPSLGVAGIPLFPDFTLLPILSIHVKQLFSFPPYINPSF